MYASQCLLIPTADVGVGFIRTCERKKDLNRELDGEEMRPLIFAARESGEDTEAEGWLLKDNP